ncbi:hemicentin-1-like isoform X2 [Neoarius graeffei]|uniref:hemicentin-1-like isoform X2 n=1 Tax=Neoarius graeffei TaxID=443677 RepID=UPI00298BD5D0|nr:hemicentin-1-like isoform X2 [Neoarius graeffei]
MPDHKRQRDLFRILLALLLCFFQQMPGTCALHPLQLHPPSIVVKFGSPVSANCSTDAPSNSIGWEISQGQVTKVENKFATWTLQKLTHWDIKPMCYINLENGGQYDRNLNITIYKPPDWVSISTVNHTGPMIEGTEYKLQCKVQDVAPLRLLTVTWYKGQQLVYTDSSFHNNNNNFPDNITSTLQISPHRDNDGVQYKCEAELKLGPLGPQPPPVASSDPLNITVYYGPEFSNCPEIVWLKEGQSLAGYCNVTGRPFPHSHWEREGSAINPAMPLNRTSSGMYEIITNRNATKSMKVEVMYGPEISCGHNYTVTEGESFIPNCTVVGHPSFRMIWYKDGEEAEMPRTMYRTHAGQYNLTAFNNNSNTYHTLEIDVRYPPSEISELQDASVSIGQYVVLKCSSNANPWPTYKWIYHQAPNVRIEDQDGVSLLHINQTGGDNIGTYTCIAFNELGKKSRKVRVDVQGAKATCPLSLRPQFIELEKGGTVNVTCDSSASTENLSWKISNNVYNVSTLLMNSTLLIEVLGWNGKASCHGQFVGLDDCQKDLNITIYKCPDQVSIRTLGLAEAEPMKEGNSYTLLCDIQNVAPVQFLTVNWYNGQNLVKSERFDEKNPANITTMLKISPNRNDTEIQLSCEAELKLGQKLIQVKSEPLNRTVHSIPVIKEKLPRQVPVFRGYPQTLICEASGYPEPTITWIFNNNRIEGGNLIVEEASGKYTCIASNSLGNDTREVNVVLEDATCELVLKPSELLVEYGASASVDCYYTKAPSTHTRMGWKASQGAVDMIENVQLITWKVDSLVHWDIQPICYLNTLAGHCQTKLPVTVYNLPDWVSISTVGHTGPMIEGKQYELQCHVHNVAPVHLLTVNWYKGQHLVAKTSFSDSTKTPVNQSTRFHMSLSRADDGVRYRCEAELELSRTRAGTQASSKVASQVLGLTVHYSPQVTSVVESFNETSEYTALNCTVTANPPPRYTWHSTNLGKEFNIGHPVLYLSSLGSGNYTCTASNGIGSVSKLFIVQAKPRGRNCTTFWAIVGPFAGLAVVMIIGYLLVKKRTINK